MDRRLIKATHVRLVQKAQDRISRAAQSLLADQLMDAAKRLRESLAVQVDAIFTGTLDELTQALEGPLGNALFVGAITELASFRDRFGKASTASEAVERYGLDLSGFPEPFRIATELPEWLVEQVRAELAASFAEPYWQGVNATTRDDLERLLNQGVVDGWSIRRMASEIEGLADGGYSRSRATLIARTESSRALNAGHTMAIDELRQETGLPIMKEWVSVLGSTTRDTHAAVDGQIVAPGENFTVGGHPARYPGDRSLPVAEVANCQCVVVSSLADSPAAVSES